MHTEQTQTNRKYKSHPFSERKRVVELYESGASIRDISRMMDLDCSMVGRWLRRYRASGLESLRPAYNLGRTSRRSTLRSTRWYNNERDFKPALVMYATALDPVSTITRRCGLDYQRFMHHLRRYHPDLIEQRNRLRTLPVAETVAVP